MQFSQKEIELAVKMKEKGLKWPIKDYDYFYSSLYEKTVGNTGKKGSRMLDLFRKKEIIWLPLFHQCKTILEKEGYNQINFNIDSTYPDKKMVVNLDINKGDKYLGQTKYQIYKKGETVLEAMYKIIIQVLEKEDKDEIHK